MLGNGTFGQVFRGHQLGTFLPVAIKRMNIEDVKKEELQIVSSLQSDFIVKIIALLGDSYFYYVIMELCDESLGQHLLRSNNQLNLGNMDMVLVSLAKGYNELFLKNIIHRDIKPQNILLRYKRDFKTKCLLEIAVAKISDFGASRVMTPNGGTVRNLAGTPLYMAPEIGANILKETDYDSKVDMWSIGVVLFECLVGEVSRRSPYSKIKLYSFTS